MIEKMKPKFSIPLSHITHIGELDEMDKKEFKKAFAEDFGTFKVTFDKNALRKGEHQSENHENEGDGQPAIDDKNTETWFFSTGKLPSLE